MSKEIKIGDTFVCIKTVKMSFTKEIAYKKGYLYKSEEDECITNLKNEKNHSWVDYSRDTKKYFLRLKN